MSGLFNSLGTVFQSVGSAVTSVPSSISTIGRAAFTAGTQGGVQAVAGAAQGTLGNVLGNVVQKAGVGALLGGVTGMVTGQGFGKGAMMGGLGGAVMGGVQSMSGGLGQFGGMGSGMSTNAATTSRSPVPAVQSSNPGGVDSAFSAPAANMPVNSSANSGAFQAPSLSQTTVAGQQAQSGGLGGFLKSNMGGKILAGVGQGLMAGMQAKEAAAEKQRDRDFVADERQKVRDSYSVNPDVYAGNAPQLDTPPPQRRMRYQWDSGSNGIVLQ